MSLVFLLAQEGHQRMKGPGSQSSGCEVTRMNWVQRMELCH